MDVSKVSVLSLNSEHIQLEAQHISVVFHLNLPSWLHAKMMHCNVPRYRDCNIYKDTFTIL